MNEQSVNEKDIVELEEYAKAGKPVPKTCKLFRIRIDREKYLVQQAALTGAELLHLADKDPDQYLIFFKKCGGKRVKIPLDTHFSFLDPGIERFITEERVPSDIVIIVNGREKIVSGKKLSFEQLVELAFENPPSGQYVVFTVTYRRGPRENREGTLTEGKTVRVKTGMVFNVTATDKS
jgi:hypothetical protein